jgi:hypothetical protein
LLKGANAARNLQKKECYFGQPVRSAVKREIISMEMANLERSIEELMADTRLIELCELQCIGGDVLDVISLSENQHSDILAWIPGRQH